MQIWGKVLGALAGLMFARIPGMILGIIVGHLFDKGYSQDFSQRGGFGRFFSTEEQLKSQAVFFHALFSVMGHVAKASGRVTEQEIRMATALMDQMQLHGQKRKEAQQAFSEGKDADFPLREMLLQFRESCHGRRDIMRVFLEILIQAAYADGSLHKAEHKILEQAAGVLGFAKTELAFLLKVYEAELRFRQGQYQQQQQKSGYSAQQSLADAYRILGVDAAQSDAEIKKAYRKLMSANHPDKLISKGLPKEAMEIAKNKAQDIQAAYEQVSKSRGMK